MRVIRWNSQGEGLLELHERQSLEAGLNETGKTGRGQLYLVDGDDNNMWLRTNDGHERLVASFETTNAADTAPAALESIISQVIADNKDSGKDDVIAELRKELETMKAKLAALDAPEITITPIA